MILVHGGHPFLPRDAIGSWEERLLIWIRWDLHSDEFCILGALSRSAARSASTSLARLSISQTGMALMFTAPWHLFATPRVHVDFAKERQISILHYSPGSALLSKIGQSQAADCWYMCRLFFSPFLLGGCWTEGLAPGFGEDQKLQRRRSCKLHWDQQLTDWQLRGSHHPVSLAARQVVVFGARQICFPNHEGQGKDLCRCHLTKQHKQQQVFGGFPLHFSSADKAVATAVTCSFWIFWGWRGPESIATPGSDSRLCDEVFRATWDGNWRCSTYWLKGMCSTNGNLSQWWAFL